MSLVKPLAFNINQGDLDTNGLLLQALETVHRSSLMPVARGHVPSGQSHFKDPLGVASFTGFGADGWFYTGGVQGRIFHPQELIDDFSDLVIDTERWEVAASGVDFQEGGINPADTPFGKRLFAGYTGGPGIEEYDRKGKMVWGWGTSDKAVLSGRIIVPLVEEEGNGLENCMLLGIQQVGSDQDYVFVGVAHTLTYPRTVVQGTMNAGVPTVTGTFAIPPGVEEIEVAIELDALAGQYRGFYSLSPIGEDYTGPTWNPVGAAQSLVGWGTSNGKPRIHASFPAGFAGEYEWRLSDVRVEIEGGNWEGNQRASWWLETQDGTNPWAGVEAECPDELLCVWERRATGSLCDLALIDTTDPSDPLLWRRWSTFFPFQDWDRNPGQFWSPGWMDTAEGHIVMTRNTYGHDGGLSGSERGEVWVVSLKWDKTLVFEIDRIGVPVVLYDSGTGRMLREGSTWGARRWVNQDIPAPIAEFDRHQVPVAPSEFVGTARNKNTEDVKAAITYGVSVRRLDSNYVCVAYGIQEIPDDIGVDAGNCYAGAIILDSGYGPAYPRWIQRKDSTSYPLWDYSDEGWIVVGLSFSGALWWLQSGEDGVMDELEGVLCRINDVEANAADNDAGSPYTEDDYWQSSDVFSGTGMNLFLMDSDPVGEELVLVSTGWLGDSYLTAVWFNSSNPVQSDIQTYGKVYPTEGVNHDFNRILPAEEYPRWFLNIFERDDSVLERCRFTGGGANGAPSFLDPVDGMWLAYDRFLGVGATTAEYQIMRGQSIERGDFVLDVKGRLVAPFAAGYGVNAIQGMSPSQSFGIGLVVSGDKRFEARTIFQLRGNSTGVGGVRVAGSLRYRTSGGSVVGGNVLSVDPMNHDHGAIFQLRIKRSQNVFTFYFYDNSTDSLELIAEVEGLRIPLVPSLVIALADAEGLAAAVGIELESFLLAPSDDPLGTVHHRVCSFNTIPSQLSSVSGGAVYREKPRTIDAAQLIVGDGWTLPGLLSRP